MVEFINRYGVKITFTQIDESTISMKGGDNYRIGFQADDPDKFLMIDPSGGPFIYQKLNMGLFDSGWEGLYVDYMTLDKDKKLYLLHLKEKTK